MTIQPYTYYRTADRQRAFLLAWASEEEQHEGKPGRVALIEWGKTRDEGTYRSLDEFKALVEQGKLVEFTPTAAQLL